MPNGASKKSKRNRRFKNGGIRRAGARKKRKLPGRKLPLLGQEEVAEVVGVVRVAGEAAVVEAEAILLEAVEVDEVKRGLRVHRRVFTMSVHMCIYLTLWVGVQRWTYALHMAASWRNPK